MKYQSFSFITRLIFPILLLCLSGTAISQNSNLLNNNSTHSGGNSDISSLIDRQIKYIKSEYSEKIEAPKEFINGKEYESYYVRSIHKPLLFPTKRRTASIITRSRKYDNLTLQYDTFLDEVIYTDITRTIDYTFQQIALNDDIIEGFNLYFDDDTMFFKYFRYPQCSDVNLKEGFYEIAYEGKSKYVIKHLSSYYVKDDMNEYEYAPENYFSVGGPFYRVKNKRNLLKLFGGKSGEIKKYLHASHIRIRQADKQQFASILKFYDSLKVPEK